MRHKPFLPLFLSLLLSLSVFSQPSKRIWMFWWILSSFDNFDTTRTQEVLETIRRCPLAQHSLFLDFHPFHPRFSALLTSSGPMVLLGRHWQGRNRWMFICYQLSKGTTCKPHTPTSAALPAAPGKSWQHKGFKGKMLTLGDGSTANSFTLGSEDPSEMFSKWFLSSNLQIQGQIYISEHEAW